MRSIHVSADTDLTTGRAAAFALSEYQITSTTTSRTNRELKMLKFVLARFVPRDYSGVILHLGEGSGYHIASLAKQYQYATFIPTDKNVHGLQEGLQYFHGILPLGSNLHQARRLTTEGCCCH